MNMTTATATIPVAQIDYRAGTLEEIQQVDVEAPVPVLPAYLYLPKDRWRLAMSPFRRERVGGYRRGRERRGPPGAGIWAQLASRAGDVIVGGRDAVGLPSVPVAAANGDIHFVSARTALGAPETTSRWIELPPSADTASDQNRSCTPILSDAGPIKCGSTECHNCLATPQRTTWYSMVACMCPLSGA
jgi:hypothetical protein